MVSWMLIKSARFSPVYILLYFYCLASICCICRRDFCLKRHRFHLFVCVSVSAMMFHRELQLHYDSCAIVIYTGCRLKQRHDFIVCAYDRATYNGYEMNVETTFKLGLYFSWRDFIAVLNGPYWYDALLTQGGVIPGLLACLWDWKPDCSQNCFVLVLEHLQMLTVYSG